MDEKKTAPAGEGPEWEVLEELAAALNEMLDTDFTRADQGQPRLALQQNGSSD